MYEENGRISWSNLFIKGIIVIIFVLFTVWLLSLSNRGISNSLGVLTDNIFAENMDRMKEVGKEYFTIERLPEEIGDVRTLTLAKMYEKKLILELKDKNGNACSAENSYISIEKLETEYQMKVFLECGEESDYIKVIMGCYDYCDTDICEVKKPEEIKNIEYEYSKTTGGKWSDWGNWSEWSKTVVTENDYRDVETKVVEEKYSYDKTVTKNEYISFVLSCPEGYTKTSDGTKCYKTVTNTAYANPNKCSSTYNGYTLVSQNGFTCNYSKNVTNTSNPNKCPSTYNGYTLVSQNGFTCNYSKNVTNTSNPNKCPSTSDGYTLVSQNGFTCNYSKTVNSTSNPQSCPSTSDGYTLVSQNGFTCNYSKTSSVPYQTTKSYTGTCYRTETKTVYPCTGCAPQYQKVKVPYSCTKTRTVTKYKDVVDNKTTSVGCPSGYTQSGSSCVKTDILNKSTTVGCPSGYTKSGNSCVKTNIQKTTTTVSCPTGYTKSGSSCVKTDIQKTTTSVSCPSGYTKTSDGKSCYKNVQKTENKDIIKSCPTGYTKTNDGTQCYKEVSSVVTVNDVRKVTYYRYRLRSYNGGVTDYKWSKSKEDKELLDAGYKLTGKTREVK